MRWRHRRLVSIFTNLIEILPPGWIIRHGTAFFEHDLSEFIDAQFGNDEFQSGFLPIFFLTEPGEYTANRTSHRQQFFFRAEIQQALSLMRDSAEPATDKQLKTALRLSIG